MRAFWVTRRGNAAAVETGSRRTGSDGKVGSTTIGLVIRLGRCVTRSRRALLRSVSSAVLCIDRRSTCTSRYVWAKTSSITLVRVPLLCSPPTSALSIWLTWLPAGRGHGWRLRLYPCTPLASKSPDRLHFARSSERVPAPSSTRCHTREATRTPVKQVHDWCL